MSNELQTGKYKNGFFGVPPPSGLSLNQSDNPYPTASSIERTMYWLDRVAEQHDWVNSYNSSPYIWQSGLIWKRHNGVELESFIPSNSSIYNLTGYPINSQDFWENYREIIKWTGDKVLRYYDMYGGQLSNLNGEFNGSGWKWKPNSSFESFVPYWDTYGHYDVAPYFLDDISKSSYVDYNESSHTKYMGRYGKISFADYRQYLPFPKRKINTWGVPFILGKTGYVTKYKFVKNFNTSDSTFLCTRNQILDDSDLSYIKTIISGIRFDKDLISGDNFLSNTCSGSILIGYHDWDGGNSGIYYGNRNISYGTTSYYSILRQQAIDLLGILSYPPSSCQYITPQSGWNGNSCVPEYNFTHQIRDGANPLIVSNYSMINAISYNSTGTDYLEYTLNNDGSISSSNVLKIPDRKLGQETREVESITCEFSDTFCGCFFPLSRDVYLNDYNDYNDTSPKNIRTFTGLTPDDSLDITSIFDYNNYGHSYLSCLFPISGINESKYKDTTSNITIIQSGYGTLLSSNGYYPYALGCINTSMSDIQSSSVFNSLGYKNYYDIQPADYQTKLIYGYVNYNVATSGIGYLQARKEICQLIYDSVKSNSYTEIGTIISSGGYSSINFDFDIEILPFRILQISDFVHIYLPINPHQPSPKAQDAGVGTFGGDVANFSRNGFLSNQYCRLGSISNVVGEQPSGNVLYISIINDGDILSDFMSSPLQSLVNIDEQPIININGNYLFDHPHGVVLSDGNAKYPRFNDTVNGNFSYSIHPVPVLLADAPNQYSNDDLNGYYFSRLRAFKYNEFGKCFRPNVDTSGTIAIGTGLHTSYGAVNSGENKNTIHFTDFMSLLSDTGLYLA